MSVVGHDEGGEGESGKGCREGRVGRWTRRGRSSREWEGVLRRACRSLDTTRADKEEGRATTRTKVRVVTPGEEVVEDLKDESGRQVRRFPTGRGAPTPKAPPHHKSGSRYRDRQPGFQTRARECSALGAAERLRGASGDQSLFAGAESLGAPPGLEHGTVSGGLFPNASTLVFRFGCR